MVPFIKAFDFVIDVHSTETGLVSTLIVTKYDPALKGLFRAIAPKRVVQMSATKSNALISRASRGIAFEYGKDKAVATFHETVVGIERALTYMGLLTPNRKTSIKKKKNVPFFKAYAVFPKPRGFIVRKGIKNFEKLSKGALIGHNPDTREKIYTKEAFYPVLFGNNSYKTIFGFKAKKQ